MGSHAATDHPATAGKPAVYAVVALAFIMVLIDGFDTASIAFVAPVIAGQWGLSPAAFTPAFVSTSLGAVVGYMVSGSMAARWGARYTGLASVLVFGLGSLATAWASSLEMLVLLRFVTAIGLGAILPIMVSLATEVISPRRRETVAMLVVTGLSAGSVLGGVLGVPLIHRHGWQSIFWVGGIVPLVLLVPLAWALSMSRSNGGQAVSASGERKPGVVRALFDGGLAPRTILLWLFAFVVFINSYALMFWIPSLLMSFGFEAGQTPLGTAALGVGGLAGSLFMMVFISKTGVKPLLALMTLLAAACVWLISRADIQQSWVLPLIAGLGAGSIACCVGQSVLAVSFYPSALRTAGVGWAAALGRIGSIVGPAVGGALLSLGWNARDIVLTAVIPAAVALVLLLGMALSDRRARGTVKESTSR